MDIDDSPQGQLLLQYYSRLYPFKSIFRWLNQDEAPQRQFTHREFAFTLKNDVYLRYNSFTTADELKKQCCKTNPVRFEIGAIYSAKPKDKKAVRAAAFTPQLRELVFDIDMTDYDSVRTCCTGGSICRRCWGFISCSVKVLDVALRDTFGFKHVLWVYSGRRGIHCWISDREAMALTDDQRKSLMGWLEVVKGGKEMTKKVNVRHNTKTKIGGLHPALQTAVRILREDFNSLILKDQNCFGNPEGWAELLTLLPDGGMKERLRDTWEDDPKKPSLKKWEDIAIEMHSAQPHEKAEMKAALEDIILQYTYPRLDAEVSKHRNHLLKAPFCIHPGTGRVCVPVDPKNVDGFNPENVPTLEQLMQELDQTVKSDPAQADWERTSLKPYIDMLDNHVTQVVTEMRSFKKAKPTLEF